MKKRKIFKRVLSVVCCLALSVTQLPLSSAGSIAQAATALTEEEVENAATVTTTTKQAVHDPSVIQCYTSTTAQEAASGTMPQNVVYKKTSGSAVKIYFVFGTQLAAAYSYDLENWTSFTPTFYAEGTTTATTNYYEVVKTAAGYSGHTSSNNVLGNLWAPDIVWNSAMGKWCLYYSMNGNNLKSSIILLTSDDIFGHYVYAGTVVYGMLSSKTTYADALENYTAATGEESITIDYSINTTTENSGVSCIDPCTFFDGDGDLWMSYGSWSGGIYLLKLDGSTGLRDTSYTYTDADTNMQSLLSAYGATENGTVDRSKTCYYDAYLGIHVAGGFYVSGEGSYIRYANGYYYLFMSYGYYSPTGGYSMRVFRAKSLLEPFTDESGTNALFSSYVDNFRYDSRGMFLMNNYQWDTMDMAEVSQGHNSVLADDDGNLYVVYHTKFADGTANHALRVHQLYYNEDGWPVAAPYDYNSTYDTTTSAAAAVDSAEIAGDYDLILHLTNNSKALDYGTIADNVTIQTPVSVSLLADGTITGDCTGTWKNKSGTAYAELVINGTTYKGVFAKQVITGYTMQVMCFTAVSDDGQAVWGSGMPDDAAVVAYNVKNVLTDAILPNGTAGDLGLLNNDDLSWGASVAWTSDNTQILADDGTLVAQPAQDTVVTMTATVTKGDCEYAKAFAVTVYGSEGSGASILASVASADVGMKLPAVSVSKETGVSLTFTVSGIVSDWTPVFITDAQEYVYLSVLNYGKENVFEASGTVSDYAKSLGYSSASAWTIFTDGKTHEATISYNADGTIDFYRDGNLMLTYKASTAIGSYKVSDLAAAMAEAVANGEVTVQYEMTNVSIGYGLYAASDSSDSSNGSGASDSSDTSDNASSDFDEKETQAVYGGIIYEVSGDTAVVTGVSKSKKTYTVKASVTIGGTSYSVTAIGAKAFKGCTKLKTLTIKSKDLTKIGKNAFKNCKKLTMVKVPGSVKATYKTLLKAAGLKSKVKVK